MDNIFIVVNKSPALQYRLCDKQHQSQPADVRKSPKGNGQRSTNIGQINWPFGPPDAEEARFLVPPTDEIMSS